MTSVPKTMKGVLIEKTGGPEVLQYKTDLPVPVPKAGEVLVKNEFSGVNFIDTYFRTGLYSAPKPEVLGRDGEGTIVALGPEGEFYGLKEGDYVIWMNTGGYAEYTAVPALKVHVIPKGIKPGVAVASYLQGLTAVTLIKEAYVAKKGDWILVHAAAGGVGLWLCQLLRVVGAKVIGTASTEDKIKLAKENGADYMINYAHEDLVARVKEITGGAGVAAVYDGVGAATFEADLEVLARRGTLASFGNASGSVPPFPISKLSAKNLKVCRPTLFNYMLLREEQEYYAQLLFKYILEENLNVRVHETYPLQNVAQAQIDLVSRKTTGKLLLKP